MNLHNFNCYTHVGIKTLTLKIPLDFDGITKHFRNVVLQIIRFHALTLICSFIDLIPVKSVPFTSDLFIFGAFFS